MKSFNHLKRRVPVWSQAIVGFVVVSLIACSTAAIAHQGDRIFPIYEITDDMLQFFDVKDGTILEWEDLLEPSLTTLDFFSYTVDWETSKREEIAFDPSDFDLRVWIGWNATHSRLYVSLQAADDHYAVREKWNQPQDWLEFRIDGDHSGGPYSFDPGARYRDSMGPAQAYILPSIRDLDRDLDGSIELSFFDSEELEWVLYPPYAEVSEGSVGENPTFWTIEFYITAFDALIWNDPDNSLTSQWMAGNVIGFDLWLNDSDTESETLYDLSDSFLRHRGNPSSNANYFVDGVLLEAGESLEHSAVQPSSWGLIKASLGY